MTAQNSQADKTPLIEHKGAKTILNSPTSMPKASAFLWNPKMMIQMNCRGYATAQFMQPEPAKYARGPVMEVTSFMQPEQDYYAHHPGRFFYIKDLQSDELFSAPYEPVRSDFDKFEFIAAANEIHWRLKKNGLEISINLSLSKNHTIELWQITLKNLSETKRQFNLIPYFPVGYMSWMNQSANFDSDLNAIVCSSITPYQKVAQYFKNKNLKDLSFLMADRKPSSWETRQQAFEGEGGLHAPSALKKASLSNSVADYETPVAAMHYPVELDAAQTDSFRFVFGAAQNKDEIKHHRRRYLSTPKNFRAARQDYADYISAGGKAIEINTPDKELDHFVNHWLARQIYYHGNVNRLCTDPQTRNYLQDAMGMTYINADTARAAFITAVSQQKSSGAMPDGILLNDQAELKYINQVPHMDHCVWLPICVAAYLDETGDYALLQEEIGFADSDTVLSIAEHIDLALRWLFEQRDHRGLNFIGQGDWCDPMNMVGYKGKGVSAWLTLASAYASRTWATICATTKRANEQKEFSATAQTLNTAVNKELWHDNWYARGITDDGRPFGIESDRQGKIFLNPQSWSMLSGAADDARRTKLIKQIKQQLEGPFGVEMLAPAFTQMHEDIGRVTQKYPGAAENGSVYNHAAAFYTYALYQHSEADHAFRILRAMLPTSDHEDLCQRGQLPVFIPNYYRGAHKQIARTAGRSSQLFNTGSVHWFYRSLIEGLFGVKGSADGLIISPNLPSQWQKADIVRYFRGATLTIRYVRNSVKKLRINVDDKLLKENLIRNVNKGQHYEVLVEIPSS